MIELRAHEGPQKRFLSSSADIAIYGGAAGGGKTWAMLLEPLRHVHRPNFGAVIFRRNATQVRNEGALWDESHNVYPFVGGKPRVVQLEWRFQSGAKVKFASLEHENSKLDWQGAQIALLCFDELTHFAASVFWYMLSRNRSTSGVRPYVRATTNPDADSWVAGLVEWWVDQATGFAIPERSGVLRWFVRHNGELMWADSAAELRERYPDNEPKSLTFIGASLDDNPTLVKADPGYRANLMALPPIDQARLLGGNWKIRPAQGLFFKIGAVQIVEHEPAGLRCCRGWDLAATEGAGDYTAGVKLGVDDLGRYFVTDVARGQWAPDDRDARIRITSEMDGRDQAIHLPQDPGQAGKTQALHFVRMLAGFPVHTDSISGGKGIRAAAFASQVNGGNVSLVRGAWNEAFLRELDNFTGDNNSSFDDQVDAAADAFNFLVDGDNTSIVPMGGLDAIPNWVT